MYKTLKQQSQLWFAFIAPTRTQTLKATLVSHPSSLKIFGFWRCSRLTGFLTDLGLQQFLFNTALPGRQHVPTLLVGGASWRLDDVRFKNIEATVAQGCVLQSEGGGFKLQQKDQAVRQFLLATDVVPVLGTGCPWCLHLRLAHWTSTPENQWWRRGGLSYPVHKKSGSSKKKKLTIQHKTSTTLRAVIHWINPRRCPAYPYRQSPLWAPCPSSPSGWPEHWTST